MREFFIQTYNWIADIICTVTDSIGLTNSFSDGSACGYVYRRYVGMVIFWWFLIWIVGYIVSQLKKE